MMLWVYVVLFGVYYSTIVSIQSIVKKNHTDDRANYYGGEKFPVKYLLPEGLQPSVSDVKRYIETLTRTLQYFLVLNDTDVNIAVGTYLCKAVLKRALLDYGNKLMDIGQYDNLKTIIKEAETVVDQRTYVNSIIKDKDYYRFTTVLRYDSALVPAIGNFNRHKLKPFIYSSSDMHDYLEEVDDATLDKYEYIELIESSDWYHVTVEESDWCLRTVAYNQEPVSMIQPFSRCRVEPYCEQALYRGPSIAYSLSHRMFNIMLRLYSRRCFMQGEEYDHAYVDYLCAHMLREVVYTARRGYFSRDTFLEHIALCGMGGYEEFHRTSWFNKIISWIDDDGCLAEFDNFEINRTMIRILRSNDAVRHAIARERLARLLSSNCHHHPMAMSTAVLALAIRHSLHHLSNLATTIDYSVGAKSGE